jgi:tripartite-type tricarboxylate transporter receptor subunit TctC
MLKQYRRGLVPRIATALLAAGAALGSPARAAEDPFLTREVRFLNAFAPGGTSDLLGRIWRTSFRSSSGSASWWRTAPAGPA